METKLPRVARVRRDMDSALVTEFSKIFEADVPSKNERLVALSALLLQLKDTNRDLYTQLKAVKRTVHQERNKFDETSIGLQSARYEHAQIEYEIQSCLSYQAKYTSLDLVSLDEYQQSTMQDICEDEHQLILGRLADELARRKAMMDEVKLAEIAKNAEREKLGKLQKELENLRDHAKTIYKMACSYKLTGFVSKAEAKKDAIQSVNDELVAYCGEKEGWVVELVAKETRTDEEPDEDGAIASSDDVEDEEAANGEQSRHTSVQPKRLTRRFEHEYIEVLPAAEHFDGAVLFYRAIPSDSASPILVTVSSSSIEDPVEYLKQLPIESSLTLTLPQLVESWLPGVPFKWIQIAAGLESDLAFTDSQRCFSTFFTALHDYKVTRPSSPIEVHDSDVAMQDDDVVQDTDMAL